MDADMSNLAERLKQPPVTQPTVGRQNWNFQTEIDPGDWRRQMVTLTYPGELQNEEDWAAAVKEMGGRDIPPGYRVRLVEMKHQTHGWSRANQGDDAVTVPTWWYRFAVEPSGSLAANADEIIKLINLRKPSNQTKATGPGVFHYLAGDLQLGKMDGDSTEGIVDYLVASLEAAVAEFKVRRKFEKLGTVHMAWLGDCIEGNQSQKGRNMWRTTLTVTEQVRLFRRLMMYGVDLFAPIVESLELDVVNGNHDEMQRQLATRGDDGHATEAAISLADGLSLNPKVYEHVNVFVPPIDSTYMTREIGSSIFTMAHGHQWRRGKAFDWWEGQTFNFQSPGAAHFLLHGHFHTMGLDHSFGVDTKRERTVICVPTFESESTWWKEKTGDMSKRGAIVMSSAGGEFRNLHIV